MICNYYEGSDEELESELTKRMKRAIRNYKPLMNNNMRTIRWAEEVDVGTGFVDSIRFEDYIESEDKVYKCRKLDSVIDGIKNPKCNDKSTCRACVNKYSHYTERKLGIMTTCFEMKISKSDFKSKNGHNFVGNRNYYVMPKDLFSKVKELIPEGIGVILYYEDTGGLRIKKECELRKTEDKDLSRYLYNSLKKWCDLNIFKLEEFLS